MSETVKHVDSLKPFLTQSLADALKAGSGNLNDLQSLLTLANKTGDQSLIAQVESSIAGDSKAVKGRLHRHWLRFVIRWGFPSSPRRDMHQKGSAGDASREPRIK